MLFPNSIIPEIPPKPLVRRPSYGRDRDQSLRASGDGDTNRIMLWRSVTWLGVQVGTVTALISPFLLANEPMIAPFPVSASSGGRQPLVSLASGPLPAPYPTSSASAGREPPVSPTFSDSGALTLVAGPRREDTEGPDAPWRRTKNGWELIQLADREVKRSPLGLAAAQLHPWIASLFAALFSLLVLLAAEPDGREPSRN